MSHLFERALGGDRAAQAEVHAILRRIARAVCRGGGPGGVEMEWEDIAQEAGQRVFTVGLRQFRGTGSFEGYLYAVVRSTVLQSARSAGRRREREKKADLVQTAPADPATGLDVRRLLSRMSEECGRLLDLVFLRGVPYDRLAAEMDILESSVRAKVSRCLRKAMDIAGVETE